MDLAHIDEDGALVIRLHADALIAATEASPFIDGYDPDGRGGPLVRVTNAAEWVKSVWYELNREAEDGTTLIHMMFDRAFLRAVENGAEGAEIVTLVPSIGLHPLESLHQHHEGVEVLDRSLTVLAPDPAFLAAIHQMRMLAPA